jgi:hypothetical protein
MFAHGGLSHPHDPSGVPGFQERPAHRKEGTLGRGDRERRVLGLSARGPSEGSDPMMLQPSERRSPEQSGAEVGASFRRRCSGSIRDPRSATLLLVQALVVFGGDVILQNLPGSPRPTDRRP